jgi:hypothetical protein
MSQNIFTIFDQLDMGNSKQKPEVKTGVYRISLLTLKMIKFDERSQALLLDSIPVASNYVFEVSFCHECRTEHPQIIHVLKRFHQSVSSVRRHLQIKHAVPDCQLLLSKEQYADLRGHQLTV